MWGRSVISSKRFLRPKSRCTGVFGELPLPSVAGSMGYLRWANDGLRLLGLCF